jgi:membrane protein implicated in regulation of membrane protease activity
MKIVIIIVMFLIGSVVTAVQALKFMELRQKRIKAHKEQQRLEREKERNQP